MGEQLTPRMTGISQRQIPTTYIVTLVPVAAALNIIGGYIQSALRLPVFLDMIGTAVAAIVLGPWWGALVGVITNTGSALLTGPQSLPFALVNVVGALVWGYGVRKFGMGKTFVRFFILNIIAGFAATITAVPIYVTVFGGATGHVGDALTASLVAIGQELVVAVFSSNILTSLADKIISGFVALAIIEALPPALTKDLALLKSSGMKRVLMMVLGVMIGAVVALYIVITS